MEKELIEDEILKDIAHKEDDKADDNDVEQAITDERGL